MRAPHRSDTVELRQRRVRILRDVENREIVLQESVDEAGERARRNHELTRHRPGRHCHPMRASQLRAREPEECLRERQTERENQSEMAEFG